MGAIISFGLAGSPQVVLNEQAIANFLRSDVGPVGRDLAIRAHHVAEKASSNASGVEINRGVRFPGLRAGINSKLEQDALGLVAIIGTPAKAPWGGHPDFSYPAYWDQNGKPWLTNALRDGFLKGVGAF